MYVWRRYFIFVCCFFLPAMEQQVLLPNCRLPGFSLSLSKLIFSLYHHFLRPFGRPPRIRHEMPLLIRLKIRPFEIARSILFEFLLRSRLAPLPKERTKIFFLPYFFFLLYLFLSRCPPLIFFLLVGVVFRARLAAYNSVIEIASQKSAEPQSTGSKERVLAFRFGTATTRKEADNRSLAIFCYIRFIVAIIFSCWIFIR